MYCTVYTCAEVTRLCLHCACSCCHRNQNQQQAAAAAAGLVTEVVPHISQDSDQVGMLGARWSSDIGTGAGPEHFRLTFVVPNSVNPEVLVY